MTTALVLYDGDPLDRSKRWIQMDQSERRRRAVEACRDRDSDILWELTHSYILLYSRAGARLSQHTVGAYRRAVSVLIDDCSEYSLLHLTRDQAAHMVRRWETAGLSASTCSVRLAGARSLYRALRWAGAVETDPLADVKPARDPTPAWERRHPYPDADVERLLTRANPVDRVLVLLGAHAGLRAAECVSLRWQDIDLDARMLKVVNGKGGKPRTVPMSSRLCDALRAIRSSDFVLPFRSTRQARNRMRQLCERAGVTPRALHALRHTCGTRIYRETGKLERAQSLLGHSDISTTRVYVHFAEDELAKSVADW